MSIKSKLQSIKAKRQEKKDTKQAKKQQKQELKTAKKQAKIDKIIAKTEVKNAKAEAIKNGTYESPIKSVISGVGSAVSSFLGGDVEETTEVYGDATYTGADVVSPTAEKKSNKGIFIGIGVVVVAILVFLGIKKK